MAPVLLTPPGSVSVKVHPVVLFSICDAFIRRNDKQERVIGTLLGNVIDGVVHVKSSYVVPHNESQDQVAVDIVHHKTMHDLLHRVTPTEHIVGWFSTGITLSSSDALIHDFYSKECNNPVHIVLDTLLSNKKFTVAGYTSKVLSLGDKPLAAEFVEVAVEVLYTDVEKVGAELMQNVPLAKPDAESMQQSIKRLAEVVERAYQYVADVESGKRKGDPVIGRYLADTLAAVPHLQPEAFDALFNESVQDVLLVTYLSNLVRAQVALAEKLGTSQLPVL